MKRLCIILLLMLNAAWCFPQVLSFENIKDSIRLSHPYLKMYDADIRSMDEAAKGARSRMPPEFGAGLWMTPYSPKYWKADEMGPGMGSFMVSAQQMFPNTGRQQAEWKYMSAMSAVEKEKKNAVLNELISGAKKYYYELVIIQKKQALINENEKLLDFMLRSAEIRYRNGLGKINAYYKVKAAVGNLQTMKLMLENEARQNKIALNTLMNRNPEINFQTDTIINEESFIKFTDTVLLTDRSDIKAIDRNIQLTLLQKEFERSKLKPEFGLRYDHMFAWGKQPWQFSLMGMMKIPIGRSTRMQKASMQSLDWKAEALHKEKEAMLNESRGMAWQIASEIEVKKKQLMVYRSTIIPSLLNNYKTMQLAYEQNTEELFMLFDAWENLNMIRLDYLDQYKQLLVMQAELEKILEINLK